MASRLQPRQKDAAKTSRSLFLWRFETAIWRVFKLSLDTAWPKESVCSGSCNCRWAPFVPARLGPKSLSVTRHETVGHLSFRWGQTRAHGTYTFRSTEGTAGPKKSTVSATGRQRAHGLYAFGSTEGTAGSVAGLETAVGHPSFRWGQGRAHGLYAFRSTEGIDSLGLFALSGTKGAQRQFQDPAQIDSLGPAVPSENEKWPTAVSGPVTPSYLFRILQLLLGTFRDTEGKAGPTDSACFVPPIGLVVWCSEPAHYHQTMTKTYSVIHAPPLQGGSAAPGRWPFYFICHNWLWSHDWVKIYLKSHVSGQIIIIH